MSDESTPRTILNGGPLLDHPGWWMIEAWKEDSPADTRSVVRKEDGTYWDVASKDLFPRSGGTLKITLGEEVTEEKRLSVCRGFYTELKNKADEDQSGQIKP